MAKIKDELLGHAADYDGIEEYDNPLPDWWVGMFIISIIWAFCYGVSYHFIFPSSQVAEYEAEMAAAEVQWPTPDTPTEVNVTPEMAAAGKVTFDQTCASCHGATLGGGIGPSLVDATWIHGSEPAAILKTITEGVTDKGMPAWGPILGPQKVQEVAAYILSKQGSGGTPAEPVKDEVVATAPVADGPIDAQALWTANCVACHKADMTGGVGPNLIDEEWIHGGDMASIEKTIKEGVPAKGMISWGPILGDEKVAALAKFVFAKSHPDAVVEEQAPAALSGKDIFTTNCVACHKADMTGLVGPNLIDDEWIHGGDLASIEKTITNGVPAKGMIGWGPILGPEAVKAVAKYVKEQGDK